MTAAYWFEGVPGADASDRAYPLRALRADGAPSADDHRPHAVAIGDNDLALVAQIRAGDAQAFERLYLMHADGLIGFAWRLCGSRAAAQDIVADLFVHLWDRRTEWQPRSGLRAYLFAAVRHRVTDAMRAERRAEQREARAMYDPSLAAQPPVSADVQAEVRDQLDAVWRIVDTFPVLRRQVMYLRWSRDLTPDEIAVVLDLSRNAVDKHLSRAVAALREAVQEVRREA